MPAALREPSSTEINHSGDKKMIHITTGKETTTLPLSRFTSRAKELAEMPMRLLAEIFPSESMQEIRGLCTSLVQCSGMKSVFVHEGNLETFATLKTRLTNKLFPHGLNRIGKGRNIPSLLGCFSQLQDSLLAAIVYTMGIPARAFQLHQLMYSGEDCNVLLYEHDVLIAFPMAKQKGMLVYAVAWVLPHLVGAALLAYLGAVRPLEIDLLIRQRVPQPKLQEYHSRYIFVRAHGHKTKRESWALDTQQLNAVVKDLGVGLSVGTLRHLVIFLLQAHCPGVVRAQTEDERSHGEAVDEQAQHTKTVGDVHYGGNVIRKRAGLDPYQMKRVKDLSLAYHALLGISSHSSLAFTNVLQKLPAASLALMETYRRAEGPLGWNEIQQYGSKHKPWLSPPSDVCSVLSIASSCLFLISHPCRLRRSTGIVF
jgi:hypothetical protein